MAKTAELRYGSPQHRGQDLVRNSCRQVAHSAAAVLQLAVLPVVCAGVAPPARKANVLHLGADDMRPVELQPENRASASSARTLLFKIVS